MDEGDIIKKFNEVFNAVAEDVSKRHGAVLYSLQNTDDDGYYNSSAGLVEAPAEENCDYPANWGAMSAIVADSVEAPEPIDPGCGDLTAKEREYLTEMCRVFNDDRAAVQKTFQHFHNHGVSQRLQNLYNESLMDIFDPNDGHSMTKGERKDIDKYMSNGLSHKQAVFKVYKERIGNSSQELKEPAQQYDAEESCDEGEETASIKNSWGSDPREDDRDEFWNDDDEDEEDEDTTTVTAANSTYIAALGAEGYEFSTFLGKLYADYELDSKELAKEFDMDNIDSKYFEGEGSGHMVFNKEGFLLKEETKMEFSVNYVEGILNIEVVDNPLTLTSVGYCLHSAQINGGDVNTAVGIDIGNSNTVITQYEDINIESGNLRFK